MIDKIAVDRNPVRVYSQMYPVRLDINHAIPLLQENDIGSDRSVRVRAESRIRQTNSAQQFSPLGDVLANLRVLLVHGALGGNESNHTTGAYLVKRFGKEIVMDQEVIAVKSLIRNLIGTEGHITDSDIEEVLPVRGFKSGNRDVRFGIEQACDPAGHAVQFHTVQMTVLHGFGQHTEEVTDTAGGLQDIPGTEAHLFQRLIHRPDHDRRSIVSVQGGRTCHIVFIRGQQLFQFGILVFPAFVFGIESLRNTAPAHIPGEDFLFFGGCAAIFTFNVFQGSDCGDIVGILGLLTAFAQMIIRNAEVLSANSHFRLRFSHCFLRFWPKSRTINIIPDIQTQQALEHFFTFRSQNGIWLRRIAHADIKEPDVFHHERLIAKVNSIPGMQLIGKDWWFGLTGSQIHHDFTHGRNPIMFGNPAFARAKRWDFRFFRDFVFFSLWGRFCFRISLSLLNNIAVFQCFRIDDFTVNNPVFSQILTNCDRINIIQPVYLSLGIELVFPDQAVQCVCGIRPRDFMPDIVHRDRKRRQVFTVFSTQLLRDFPCGMSFLHEAHHCMLAFDVPVPFPERALDIHLGNNPVC